MSSPVLGLVGISRFRDAVASNCGLLLPSGLMLRSTQFCDLQVITRSRVQPEALDNRFKCHIDQQERAR